MYKGVIAPLFDLSTDTIAGFQIIGKNEKDYSYLVADHSCFESREG